MQKSSNLQTEKTLKKPLDKRREKCYNMQAVNAGYSRRDGAEKITKKVEKLLKNLLTNARRCDIIVGHFRTEEKRSRKVLEKS